MRVFHSLGHVLGGSLLVAGTAIGVGMLAMPVASGAGGFFPSIFVYLICWLFMLCTGLLLTEAFFWMPKETGFISLAETLLGSAGRVIFWILYLFLFATVMVAHAAGGAAVLTDLFEWSIPNWLSAMIYTGVFAPVVYLGARSVDRLNLFLISGVILFYFGFIAVSYSYVTPSLLTHAHWGKAWLALPILFTAFTYQVIIPTLINYLQRDIRKVRKTIIIGSTIPLAIYLVWELLILGIVPLEGEGGLAEAARLGHNAIGPLRQFVQSPHLFTLGKYFAFFALTTSYVPLALSFFDFLADGFRWKKDGAHRFLLCLIVFGIPLLIAILYPRIFLVALSYAGGISCAFLFGLMPPLLVWIGRYRKNYPQSSYRLPGGKPLLAILMGFGCLVLGATLFQQFT